MLLDSSETILKTASHHCSLGFQTQQGHFYTTYLFRGGLLYMLRNLVFFYFFMIGNLHIFFLRITSNWHLNIVSESIFHLQVVNVKSLVVEVVNISAKERCLLDECQDLLSIIRTMQVSFIFGKEVFKFKSTYLEFYWMILLWQVYNLTLNSLKKFVFIGRSERVA